MSGPGAEMPPAVPAFIFAAKSVVNRIVINRLLSLQHMKQILTAVLTLVMVVPCFAQRDIKTFNKKGRAGIVALLGEPIREDGYDSDDIMEFSDGTVISFDHDTKELTGFETKSSKYCFLSNYLPGGFKVGDPFSKLKTFDFTKTKYGRNDPGNALKRTDNGDGEWYIAYREEYNHIMFRIENNRISEIVFYSSEDIPYEDYHNPYSLW